MADPAADFSRRRSDPHGVGPFRFVYGSDFGSGVLGSGEVATLDLREDVFNNTAGYYVVLSPAGYDEVEVTNRDTGNDVLVTINDGGQLDVPPDTIQSRTGAGMYRFTVENAGSTDIASGDIVIELQKSPYNADDAARDRLIEPPWRSMVRNFTGM